MNIIITGASSGVGFEAVLELILTGKHQGYSFSHDLKISWGGCWR